MVPIFLYHAVPQLQNDVATIHPVFVPSRVLPSHLHLLCLSYSYRLSALDMKVGHTENGLNGTRQQRQ
jgi:hypothetical protein